MVIIYTFVLLKSNLTHSYTELMLMKEFLHDSLSSSQEGFLIGFLTFFSLFSHFFL